MGTSSSTWPRLAVARAADERRPQTADGAPVSSPKRRDRISCSAPSGKAARGQTQTSSWIGSDAVDSAAAGQVAAIQYAGTSDASPPFHNDNDHTGGRGSCSLASACDRSSLGVNRALSPSPSKARCILASIRPSGAFSSSRTSAAATTLCGSPERVTDPLGPSSAPHAVTAISASITTPTLWRFPANKVSSAILCIGPRSRKRCPFGSRPICPDSFWHPSHGFPGGALSAGTGPHP